MVGESEPIYLVFHELSGVDNGYLKRDEVQNQQISLVDQ